MGQRVRNYETHIIHFIGGYKRTIKDVVDVWENEMLHLRTSNDVEWIVNKNNVLATQVIQPEVKGAI